MKVRTGKVIGAAAAVLLLCIVAGLFFFPEIPFYLMQKGTEEQRTQKQEAAGSAALTVREKEKSFDGHGIFNPLDGVQALDNDGSDIIGKVAVNYNSGRTIDKKEIHYVLYDSKGERMDAVCDLILENYEGPSVTLGEIEKVTWEDLQKLAEVLVRDGKLTADDGFGNDASAGVACSYEVTGRSTAEVQFSLSNVFRDYCVKKVVVQVEDIPEDIFYNMTEE